MQRRRGKARAWQCAVAGLLAAMQGATVAAAPTLEREQTVARLVRRFEPRLLDTAAARCAAQWPALQREAWRVAADPRVAMLLQMALNCRAVLATPAARRDDGAALWADLTRWDAQARRHGATALGPALTTTLWRLLAHDGQAALAERWIARATQPLLARARAGDAQATQTLVDMAESLYGDDGTSARLAKLHAQFVAELGPEAPPCLAMARVLSVTHRRLGRSDVAATLIEPAWQAAQHTLPPDAPLRAWLLSERGMVQVQTGELMAAIESQHESARFWAAYARAHPEGRQWQREVRALYNLASMSLAAGDFSLTIRHADDAEALARASASHQLLQETLPARCARLLARHYLGDPQALADLRQLIEAESNATSFALGDVLEEQAALAAAAGQTALADWAGERLRRFISARTTPLQSDRALALLMDARHASTAAAADSLRWRAIALVATGRSPAHAAQVYFDTANAWRPRDPLLATALAKQGALAMQRRRSDLSGSKAELQRAGLARYEPSLRALIHSLIDQGRLTEGSQALALLQEQELGEFARRRGQGAMPVTASLSLTLPERALAEQLARTGSQLRATANRIDTALEQTVGREHRERVHSPEAEAALTTAVQDLVALADRLRAPADGLAEPPRAPVDMLPPDLAELRYVVRAEGVDLLWRTATAQGHVRLAITAAELARQTHALRQALERNDAQALPLAQSLHAALVAPALPALDTLVQGLRLSTDGVLRYLPFAALHDGRQFLVERFALSQSTRPAAAAVAPREAGLALGLGASAARPGHAPLPAVERELAALARARPALLLQDDQFRLDALRQALAAQPRLVHLASHFVLDAGGDADSYLLLGDGERLSLAALGQLPWQGVELAVLSACDTGTHIATGRGRELIGLAATLQGAGVQQVLATQWRVADAAAADWAEAFYAQLGTGTAAPPTPELLARTQRAWLAAHRSDGRAHPHYWAAYTWFD